MGVIKDKFKLKADEASAEIRDLLKQHGNKVIGEVTLSQIYQGMRGITGLVTETSYCTTNNIKEPIWSSGGNTIAVCGIDYYNSDKIPAWKNSILMTTLKDASLRQLELSSDGNSVVNTTIFFKNVYGRLRDICISPSGNVYLCTSNGGNDDKIIEVTK